MESIGDLDRVRCALATALRVGASTITYDDFDAQMVAKPLCEHLSGAIVQQSIGRYCSRSISSVP